VTLHILLVEDSATDAKLVVQVIRAAGHVVELERVDEPEALRAALAAKKWDVVVSDWSMPRFSALAALQIVKEQTLDLPFIIASGTIGEEAAVEAMRAGADDYVLKDRLTRLPAAIERALREHALRTSHRRSEEARRASEVRFSRLAESGIIGIVVGDLDGNILEANDTFLAMVGYTRFELEASQVRWRDLTAPEWQTVTNHGVAQLRECGVATPYTKEYVRKDGSRIAVLVGIAMVDATRSLAFMVDLTAQNRAEAALAKSEAQLRQAQKMEAVGRLAGGVAHDFNNLLSVILTYSEMILERLVPDDPLRDDVEEIGSAGRRAADLTRQLLTFSRQEVIEPRNLALHDVLANLDKMLQRILGEDIDLVSLHGEDLGRIRADRGNIEQVILNLAVNARDAMPTGGKLTIETRNVVLDAVHAAEHLNVVPGEYVMLAISDTGTGMDHETQRRIFEPFFTTKERGKGTGLGLATVFGIVQQCKGSIWVYSESGLGTTFKIYLPRIDDAAEPAALGAEPSARGGTETILLVEDEPQIRSVARLILDKLGYRVIEASGPRDALLRCDDHVGTIDLLLTDVVMPTMSGPELAKRVLLTRPEVRVLCMSGYTDDALVRHGAIAAGIAYLQKPLTPATLGRKVRAVLDALRP
jgi:two-component system, cell cycle sensor histidine kinase and response regulator CckA